MYVYMESRHVQQHQARARTHATLDMCSIPSTQADLLMDACVCLGASMACAAHILTFQARSAESDMASSTGQAAGAISTSHRLSVTSSTGGRKSLIATTRKSLINTTTATLGKVRVSITALATRVKTTQAWGVPTSPTAEGRYLVDEQHATAGSHAVPSDVSPRMHATSASLVSPGIDMPLLSHDDTRLRSSSICSVDEMIVAS